MDKWYVLGDGAVVEAKSEEEAKKKAINGEFFSIDVFGRDEVVDIVPTKVVYPNVKTKSSLELFKEYKEYVDSLLRQTKGLGDLYNRFSAIEEELLLRLKRANNGF